MKLVHMSGAGNLFLVGDVRDSTGTTLWDPEAIRSLIDRHPRADALPLEGVLHLTSSTRTPTTDIRFTADYYNPDGSHGMMCGNGARCIVRFAVDELPIVWDREEKECCELAFLLNGVQYRASIDADTVTIHFPAPKHVREYAIGELADVDIPVWYLDLNTDHVVIDGPLDATRPVVQILRYHPAFPRGVNVNMVDVIDRTHANIATFERGVEGITGACGTGALSAAIALHRSMRTENCVTFFPPSGRPLTCRLTVNGDEITSLSLTGDARYDSSSFLELS